jgi:hypothetical protein
MLMTFGLVAVAGAGPSSAEPQRAVAASSGAGQVVTAPLHGHHAQTVVLASGVGAVVITSRALGGDALSAGTPAGSERPVLHMTKTGAFRLSFASVPDSGGSGPSSVHIVLNRSVPWSIRLDGGATSLRADLRPATLKLLSLATGVKRVSVRLSARRGTQVVRESGGASQVSVRLPHVVATRVTVHRGAGRVRIGRRTHRGVEAGTTFTRRGYSRARDRLDLELRGGVSKVAVGSRKTA